MDFTQTDLNKTPRVAKERLERNRKWVEIDATDVVLGRLASVVAARLHGKDKAHYCDFWDAGDFVIIQNVDKMAFTGQKLQQKNYYRYSGYKGNLKTMNLREMMKKDPTKVLWFAVRGMLPKNKLRDMRMKRLKMFAGQNDQFNYFKPEKVLVNN